MNILSNDTKNQLLEIGRQLDCGVFPIVKNGGIVLPSESAIPPKNLGKENQNAGQRQKAPRERVIGAQRPFSGPQRTSARYGASGATPSVVDAVIGNTYESLSDVDDAYPGMQVWKQEGGFWLYTESGLLPGLTQPVSFLTAVSTAKGVVRSWAFYCSAVGVKWLGPRHTNFPDGSICAYDLNDGTWTYGDSIVNLLDIYTVWALRHLHYATFGQWPGPQSVPLLYERLLEFEDNELCGCGVEGKKYIDCCKNSDLQANLVREAIKFGEFSCWSIRQPPREIAQFMCNRNHPPQISEIIV